MRWFKHMTATRDDEKIVRLISEGGMEAYGFYWAIVELIAKQIEKDSTKCSVTYPLPYLLHQVYLHHNKVTNLLGQLQVTGLITLSKVEVRGVVNYVISCPNLLKYRDEYTARTRKNRDKVGTKSRQTHEQETDTDTDTDTEAEGEQKHPPVLGFSWQEILNALNRSTDFLSEEEQKIARDLKTEGCILEDFKAAFQETVNRGKPKRSLKYLRHMIRDQRDQRQRQKEADEYEPEFV